MIVMGRLSAIQKDTQQCEERIGQRKTKPAFYGIDITQNGIVDQRIIQFQLLDKGKHNEN